MSITKIIVDYRDVAPIQYNSLSLILACKMPDNFVNCAITACKQLFVFTHGQTSQIVIYV